MLQRESEVIMSEYSRCYFVIKPTFITHKERNEIFGRGKCFVKIRKSDEKQTLDENVNRKFNFECLGHYIFNHNLTYKG